MTASGTSDDTIGIMAIVGFGGHVYCESDSNDQGALLLTPVNFNFSMDKQSHFMDEITYPSQT